MTDKKPMPKLLPCPFCGGEAHTTHHSNNFDGIRLMSVGCCASVLDYEPQCYFTWNTRADLAPAVDAKRAEALERLQLDADNAYCRYVDEVDKKCRGFEYKIQSKTITHDEIQAYAKANELLGQHRGINHAIKMIAALAAPDHTELLREALEVIERVRSAREMHGARAYYLPEDIDFLCDAVIGPVLPNDGWMTIDSAPKNKPVLAKCFRREDGDFENWYPAVIYWAEETWNGQNEYTTPRPFSWKEI